MGGVIAILSLTLLSSCEAPYVGPLTEETEGLETNVTIQTSIYQQTPFETTMTRALQPVGELCTRVGFAVFKNGEKVKSLNQTQSTDDFGKANFQLSEGEYQIVIIAHNCDGTATITSEDKITFPNNVVSDTFFYYGTFTVGDGVTVVNAQLSRAVAMVRLNVTDVMPANVRQMQFYYTGGSSTFGAKTGYGNVNSRQTVKMDVGADMVGKATTWEIYTLPHAETGELKLTVSALDGDGNVLYEKQLDKVPVTVNAITTYSGQLFGGDPQSVDSKQFVLTADGAWNVGEEGTF